MQQQLIEILGDLAALRIESTLILGSILLLIVGLIKPSGYLIKAIYGLVLLAAFYFSLTDLSVELSLSKSIQSTPHTNSFSMLILVVGLGILIFRRASKHATEFYFLILSLIIGSLFMMKANSLLLVFIAVELTSFTGYILTNFKFEKGGHEASMKYLLFGATSSAIMLVGISIIYGSTNTLILSELEPSPGLGYTAGLFLFVCGILFKASIVPFHIWVPATYQKAPSDAVAMFSIIPKLAAFVLLDRLTQNAILTDTWLNDAILMLGIASIIAGTLGALVQKNAKRLVSFGAIAHSGFLLPLVLIRTETAFQVFWWYSVIYAIMNLAIFYLLDLFENKNISLTTDFKKTQMEIITAITVTIVLISLVGLPPLAGFTAKLFLFTTLWESYIQTSDLLMLSYLIVAVFATVIALFYYLRIPYYLFLVKGETSQSIEFSSSTKFIATLFSIVLLLLFFVPQIVSVMQHLLNSQLAP